MGRRTPTFISRLRCTGCDNVYEIPRPTGKKRERGHVKHMFCWRCGDTTE